MGKNLRTQPRRPRTFWVCGRIGGVCCRVGAWSFRRRKNGRRRSRDIRQNACRPRSCSSSPIPSSWRKDDDADSAEETGGGKGGGGERRGRGISGGKRKKEKDEETEKKWNKNMKRRKQKKRKKKDKKEEGG